MVTHEEIAKRSKHVLIDFIGAHIDNESGDPEGFERASKIFAQLVNSTITDHKYFNESEFYQEPNLQTVLAEASTLILTFIDVFIQMIEILREVSNSDVPPVTPKEFLHTLSLGLELGDLMKDFPFPKETS